MKKLIILVIIAIIGFSSCARRGARDGSGPNPFCTNK
jgi:hypothetical protein